MFLIENTKLNFFTCAWKTVAVEKTLWYMLISNNIRWKSNCYINYIVRHFELIFQTKLVENIQRNMSVLNQHYSVCRSLFKIYYSKFKTFKIIQNLHFYETRIPSYSDGARGGHLSPVSVSTQRLTITFSRFSLSIFPISPFGACAVWKMDKICGISGEKFATISLENMN